MTAISWFTGTSAAPSGTTILARVPSSTASYSMVALSVSISAITSPGLTLSPSFLSHLARLPFSMVGDSAGIRMLIGMARFLSAFAALRSFGSFSSFGGRLARRARLLFCRLAHGLRRQAHLGREGLDDLGDDFFLGLIGLVERMDRRDPPCDVAEHLAPGGRLLEHATRSHIELVVDQARAQDLEPALVQRFVRQRERLVDAFFTR